MGEQISQDRPSKPLRKHGFVSALLERMTLAEKIGQLNQLQGGDAPDAELLEHVRAGAAGSVINSVDPTAIARMQRVAVEESRLGIPLLFARDVIHGFSLVAPIPLGQAATFDPGVLEDCARIAAEEASRNGITWTFAPMLDIARDARWGRIAESLGEDPVLAGRLAAAMVRGFQGESLAEPTSLAACAKHFVGYGAVEAGRDYATTLIPPNEMRNVYLPPFRDAVAAGCATLMTSFSDLDGVPATANAELLDDILRREWGYAGVVVSDWESVSQLAIHGIAEDRCDAARQAMLAGVDVDMASESYADFLAQLVADNRVSEAVIDLAAARVLALKLALGLFDDPRIPNGRGVSDIPESWSSGVYDAAVKSAVLLKNEAATLPLKQGSCKTIAVIGPLADAAHDQMGTWVFDGDPGLSVTCLQALRDRVGDVEFTYAPGLSDSRSRDESGLADAAAVAEDADLALLFLGEEAILSGEAHCRADIDLPGAQELLLARVAATGTPVVVVILAGRPLTLAGALPHCQAMLYAWHPGSMAGPAIADLLFGAAIPSGKLPVSFPRMVGQIPIHYNHKRGGKPASDDSWVHIDDIEPLAPQTSLGMTSFHLDAGFQPQFPFGFGLSYVEFKYRDLSLDRRELKPGEQLTASVTLCNNGDLEAEEVVQLYLCDLVGSVTRPVRELKEFRRVTLGPGEQKQVDFVLHSDQLRFYGRANEEVLEPGEFHLWIGGSSTCELRAGFRLLPPD